MELEKVKVKHTGKRGFKNINKCDFDEKIHKLYTEPKPRKPRAKKVKDDDN